MSSSELLMNKYGSIQLISEQGKVFCFRNEIDNNEIKHFLPFPDSEIWNESNLFFEDIPRGNEAHIRQVNKFKGEGNPQISLLMAEVFFICKCTKRDAKNLIIYVGGHPGDHINFLAKFFPEMEFHVFDFLGSNKENFCMNKIGPDPYLNNGESLKNITKIYDFFSNDKARKYLAEFSDRDIYLISDIRDKSYQNNISAEESSQIIDRDTYSQLEWCKILKPKFALLKYRPKLPSECLTVHPNLGDSKDMNDESKKLYYSYPRGKFLRIPFQKKAQKAMYFITNNYEQTERYYHHDMISAINYHHGYTRRCLVYDNPTSENYLLNKAIFTVDDVRNLASEKNIRLPRPESAFDYCLGCSWDERASVHVVMCLVKYFGLTGNLKDHLAYYCVFPYMFMRQGEQKTTTSETKPEDERFE